MSRPLVLARDGTMQTPVWAAIIDQMHDAVAALPRRTPAEAAKRLGDNIREGRLPRYDAWGRRIIDDPVAEREAIERRLRLSSMATPAGADVGAEVRRAS